MDIFISILIVIIVILFIYLIYKKINKNTNKNTNKKTINQLNQLIKEIKNNVTITLYNMNKFINVPNNMKKILLEFAHKYKHEDLIKCFNQK